jgi:Ca2+-binding RTX toxin-like protein
MTILQGTTGDDDLRLAPDNTSVVGGGGTDTIDVQDATAPVTVDLVNGTVTAPGWLPGTVTLSGITQIYGGYNGGTLTGGANTTYISATGGDTTVNVGPLSTTVVLGLGSDTVHGGAGNDEIYVGGSATSNNGNTIDGGGGYNGVSYAGAYGPLVVDLYAGLNGVGGGAWHNGIYDHLINIVNIVGNNNGDTIRGDWQNNIIVGGTGNDTIQGREGNDTLTGGGGSDTFIMDAGIGHTVITDFSIADDKIDLSAFTSLHSLADVLGVTSQQGADTVIALGSGALTLRNVTMGNLTAADFGFVGGTSGGPTVGPGIGGTPTTGSGTLNGTSGSDWLQGGSGNDILHGGAGSDYLDGGAGLNTATYDGFFRQYTVAVGSPATVSGGPEGGMDDLANIQRIQFVDGYLATSPTDTAGQVYRVYEATLDRAPDPEGLANWVHALNGGTSLQTVVNGFVSSQEFQAKYGNLDNTAFVTLLYHNVLDRAPDAEGLSNWVNALNGGESRAQVVLGFSESQENIANQAVPVQHGLWIQDAAAAQAARLYDTVFGRLPDASGLTNWTHSLESGTSLQTVSADFVASQEFQSKYGALDNTAFLTLLYHNVLHRAPDTDGLNNWLNTLNTGHSRAEVVMDFSESQEHVADTASHIDHGIWLAS